MAKVRVIKPSTKRPQPTALEDDEAEPWPDIEKHLGFDPDELFKPASKRKASKRPKAGRKRMAIPAK